MDKYGKSMKKVLQHNRALRQKKGKKYINWLLSMYNFVDKELTRLGVDTRRA